MFDRLVYSAFSGTPAPSARSCFLPGKRCDDFVGGRLYFQVGASLPGEPRMGGKLILLSLHSNAEFDRDPASAQQVVEHNGPGQAGFPPGRREPLQQAVHCFGNGHLLIGAGTFDSPGRAGQPARQPVQ
jgi:hypothetical protein